MFGSSKTTSGQSREPERPKPTNSPNVEFNEDIPPMPEMVKPPQTPSAPAPKKAFNFAEKPKAPVADDAAHLYIGANIRLKGEIAGCDLMRVEGIYEGIAKARQLVLCPGGSFLGTAEIEDAEIEGIFEGALHVRGRLFLRKQGRIRGTFSYGQLEIERGGEIDGRILPFEKKVTQPAAAPKPAEAPKPTEAVKPSAAPQAASAPVAHADVLARPAPKPASPLNGSQPAAAE